MGMRATERQLEAMHEWMINATVEKRKHYIEKCPTFWKPRDWYTCPDCGERYPCYYDGHDCECGTTNLCGGCAIEAHANH